MSGAAESAGGIEPRELLDALERAVVGKRRTMNLLLAALLAGGHALIEDVPGVAKTLAARALARVLGLRFGRAQMTPDLLPADLTGGSVWDESRREFVFHPGPIFAQILLVDELNRATPRTQAGLLEAMEEGAVSVDGGRHELPWPFFVVATQNPAEQYGVFPLPEAQLDRFLIQVRMGYPAHEEEVAILRTHGSGSPLEALGPMLGEEDLRRLRAETAAIHVSEPVLDYIVRLSRATRRRAEAALGASPRASLGLLRMSRALARIEGAKFVTPDHVKLAAPEVFRHRIALTPQARLAGASTDDMVAALLQSEPAPISGGAG